MRGVFLGQPNISILRRSREEHALYSLKGYFIFDIGIFWFIWFFSCSTFGHEKTISLISDEEETAFQTKSFSYSKFTIEQQLQKLEKRMREEGYTVEEFTEGDFAHSYFNASSEKKLSKKFSGICVTG